MARLSIAAVSAVLLLVMLSGCPGTTDPPDTASKPDTSLATQSEICETLPPADSALSKPEPELKPEAPKPKALPRMWDFGSESCLPCKTMKEILDPMMVEYKDKVDIRIINVYEDKESTRLFRIVTIPTQVFLDADGKELFRHIGVYPRDSIEAKFKGFGFPVVSGTSVPAPAPATGGT